MDKTRLVNCGRHFRWESLLRRVLLVRWTLNPKWCTIWKTVLTTQIFHIATTAIGEDSRAVCFCWGSMTSCQIYELLWW